MKYSLMIRYKEKIGTQYIIDLPDKIDMNDVHSVILLKNSPVLNFMITSKLQRTGSEIKFQRNFKDEKEFLEYIEKHCDEIIKIEKVII